MALSKKETYTFQPLNKGDIAPFFEVSKLSLDTYCVLNENEVSEHFKIFWVADGAGTYQIDFNELVIKESGIFCLSPGQIFSVQSEKARQAYQIAFNKDFYCVEAHGKEIACNGILFNNVHRASAVSVQVTDRVFFQQLIQQMIQEMETKGNAHRDMLEAYLRQFLIRTLRLVNTNGQGRKEKPVKLDRTAEEFIALVEKHFRKEHTVAGYAQKMFISPKTLAKRLHNQGYATPLQIIKDRLILEAKRQLKFSNKSVKEIAFELGFDDPAYFGGYMNENYLGLANALDLSKKQIADLVKNSFKASWLPDQEKEKRISEVEDYLIKNS